MRDERLVLLEVVRQFAYRWSLRTRPSTTLST